MKWSGPTDGASDCTPYFDSMTASITAADDVTLEIPAGQFTFSTQPKPLPRMNVRGQGKLATVLNKKFDNGALFTLDGKRGGGTRIEHLAALTYAGYAPGYFVYAAGDDALQPDVSVLRDLWVSSNDGGLWYANVVLDGGARVNPAPQGLRNFLIEDCELFNAVSCNLYAYNAVGLKVRGLGCYPGGGPTYGCGIYVAGDPNDPGRQSTRCFFDDCNVNGFLNVAASFECSYRGSLGQLIASDPSAAFWRIDARCPTSLRGALTTSEVTLW